MKEFLASTHGTVGTAQACELMALRTDHFVDWTFPGSN